MAGEKSKTSKGAVTGNIADEAKGVTRPQEATNSNNSETDAVKDTTEISEPSSEDDSELEMEKTPLSSPRNEPHESDEAHALRQFPLI